MQPLKPLDLPVPPMLEESIGYSGDERYVAFYWTPFGDEVMWDTGYSSATGEWQPWLLFVQHRLIAPALGLYNLGSSEQEATHSLLLDREERTCAVGLVNDVRAFLHEVNRPAAIEGQAEAEPFVIDEAVLNDFVNQIRVEQFTLTSEEVYANLADQERQQRELLNWLDSQ